VGKLLAQKPKGYDEAAKYLSRRGYRVISLAYKPLSSMADVEAAKDTRSVCEEKLIFAGCVAFTCRVRRDTKLVLQRLKEGGMTVAMVTGDALLTAIHVAKEVDICDSENPSNTSQELTEKNKELRLLLEKRRAEKGTMIANGHGQKKAVKPILILEQDESGDMFWQSYEDDSRGAQYVAKDVPQLAKSHDLAVTGSNLATAYEYDPATKTVLEHFKVFARMTPDAKETVIECLHSVGKLCLMCGDGANDVRFLALSLKVNTMYASQPFKMHFSIPHNQVGALKQADVGVALLSGFGDVNVDKGEDGNVKKEQTDGALKINPNMTVISRQDMEAARNGPMWLLRAKIKAIGVDLSKYPELTEREDLLKLFEIKGRERAVTLQEQKVRLIMPCRCLVQ
jgi:cation-transporting ATPase 13A1